MYIVPVQLSTKVMNCKVDTRENSGKKEVFLFFLKEQRKKVMKANEKSLGFSLQPTFTTAAITTKGFNLNYEASQGAQEKPLSKWTFSIMYKDLINCFAIDPQRFNSWAYSITIVETFFDVSV